MADSMPMALKMFLNEANKAQPIYSPVEVRALTEQIVQAFSLAKQRLAFVEDRSFEHDGQLVSVRIYHPQPDKAVPVIIYYHGGGHVCGSLDSHDGFCRHIAQTSGCAVMAVAYRLAPEFPYPAGLEDCLAAYQHRAEILANVQIDSHQVFLAGDSAGGNLALSVAKRVGEDEAGASDIRGLMLIYPSVDFTMQQASIEHLGEGYLLTKTKIQWYFDQYFSAGGDRRKASPLFFDNLETLPPLYIAVAEFDPLHDEGVAFANKVEAIGIDVKLETYPGMIHAFVQLESLVPTQVKQLTHTIANFVNALR